MQVQGKVRNREKVVVRGEVSPRNITLVQHGMYLVPRSDFEVKVLFKGLGTRLSQYHVDFLPTLRFLAPKKFDNRKIVVVPFNSAVFEPMLDKLESFVEKHGHRIKFDENSIKITAKGEDTFRFLSNIETKLRFFFERWGFSLTVQHTKLKAGNELYIEYYYDSVPVIRVGELQHEPDFEPAIIEFDDFRILISKRDRGYFGFTVEHKEFGEWVEIAGNSKLSTKKLRVAHVIATLMELSSFQGD